jgi:hypothetical protein
MYGAVLVRCAFPSWRRPRRASYARTPPHRTTLYDGHRLFGVFWTHWFTLLPEGAVQVTPGRAQYSRHSRPTALSATFLTCQFSVTLGAPPPGAVPGAAPLASAHTQSGRRFRASPPNAFLESQYSTPNTAAALAWRRAACQGREGRGGWSTTFRG